MRKYEITITGKTPLLMHWDNIDWADTMDEWKDDPANRKDSKAGDDRSPAWRWIGSTYHDGTYISLPSANLMRAMMEGGTMVPVPGGRGGKTFKAQTQSGMMVDDTQWPLLVAGAPIEFTDLKESLRHEKDFRAHKEAAVKNGFSLFVKRAKVGQKKHIRVRPRFDGWSAVGMVSVWDEKITIDVLRDVLKYAGDYKGLGDWRPGGKTPGSYGMFSAEVKKVS